jgi:hypothetical protein
LAFAADDIGFALLLLELRLPLGEKGSPLKLATEPDLTFRLRSSTDGPGVPRPAVVERAERPPILDMLPARCLRDRRRCVKGETVLAPEPSMTACCAGSEERGRKVPIMGTGAKGGAGALDDVDDMSGAPYMLPCMGMAKPFVLADGETGADAEPGEVIEVGSCTGNGGAAKSNDPVGGPGSG